MSFRDVFMGLVFVVLRALIEWLILELRRALERF
jgi:hypothetical protein